MSSWMRTVGPRDRAAAARTLVLVAVIGFVANIVWELQAIVDGTPTDPAVVAGMLVVGTVVVAVAVACWRAPERFSPWLYAAFPLVAVAFQVGICLGSGDATTSG